jgi:hypothetical protein
LQRQAKPGERAAEEREHVIRKINKFIWKQAHVLEHEEVDGRSGSTGQNLGERGEAVAPVVDAVVALIDSHGLPSWPKAGWGKSAKGD